VKGFVIFAFIPLILSIGIAPALPFANAEVPDWVKNTAAWWAEGKVSTDEYLASLQWLINEGIIQVPSDIEAVKEMEKESTGETFETRIGTLTLEADYPSADTKRILEDELFYQRAVQVYLLSIPGIAGAGLFDDHKLEP